MLSDTPQDVIPKPQSWYDTVILTDEDMERFYQNSYASRNEKILKLLKGRPGLRVFDMAAGSSYLAEKMLQRKGFDVELYTLNDFCYYVRNYCANRFSHDNLEYDCRDLETIEGPLDKWNTFICISMEHIKEDIRLLSLISSGSLVILGTCSFKSQGHVRIFDNKKEIAAHFGKQIRISNIFTIFTKNKWKKKYIVLGRKL